MDSYLNSSVIRQSRDINDKKYWYVFSFCLMGVSLFTDGPFTMYTQEFGTILSTFIHPCSWMQVLDASFLHGISRWVQSTLLASCLHSMQWSEWIWHHSFNGLTNSHWQQPLSIGAKKKSFQQQFFWAQKCFLWCKGRKKSATDFC